MTWEIPSLAEFTRFVAEDEEAGRTVGFCHVHAVVDWRLSPSLHVNFNIDRLLESLTRFGFTVRDNDSFSLCAVKPVETAVGTREISVTHFKAADQLWPVYYSEGRNVLESIDTLGARGGDFDTFLTEVETRVKDTYAVRLLAA